MTKSKPLGGLTILKVLAGFAGGTIVFILANRRVVTVGYRFAVWEITEQWPLLAILAGFALLLPTVYLVLRILRVPILSSRLLFARHQRWSVTALALFVGTMALLSITYLRQRYAYFSEASFQIRALKNIEQKRFLQARASCVDYVALYPQRSTNGRWPDPVCTPILLFTEDMGVIAAYLQNRPAPSPQMRDGIWLPVDFSMRGPAIAKTKSLAGGRIATSEPTPNLKKKSETE